MKESWSRADQTKIPLLPTKWRTDSSAAPEWKHSELNSSELSQLMLFFLPPPKPSTKKCLQESLIRKLNRK